MEEDELSAEEIASLDRIEAILDRFLARSSLPLWPMKIHNNSVPGFTIPATENAQLSSDRQEQVIADSSMAEATRDERLPEEPFKKMNPFGYARPREIVLRERGIDWRMHDMEMDHKAASRKDAQFRGVRRSVAAAVAAGATITGKEKADEVVGVLETLNPEAASAAAMIDAEATPHSTLPPVRKETDEGGTAETADTEDELDGMLIKQSQDNDLIVGCCLQPPADDDDDTVNVWNLRKCSAAGLANFSNVFGDEIIPTLMPLIQKLACTTDSTWNEREAVVLAIGAVTEGGINGLYPHISEIVSFLIPLLDDKFSLVRNITCWTLSRFTKFIVQVIGHQNGHEQFDKVVMGLLCRILDSTKRVQEAACSAFATLEEEVAEDLAPRLEIILQHLIYAYEKYQSNINQFISQGTLADAVGGELTQPKYQSRWQELSLFECFTSIAQALVPGFSQIDVPIFQRCIILIRAKQMARIDLVAIGVQNDKEFIVYSLDLSSGLAEGLRSGIGSLVAQRDMRELLLQYCIDESADVRQSALALLGDLAKVCPVYLHPRLLEFLNVAAIHLSAPTIKEVVSVATNACWAIGELVVKLYISRFLHLSDSALACLPTRCKNFKSLILFGCTRKATNMALQGIGSNYSQMLPLNLSGCEDVSDTGMVRLALGSPDLRAWDLCGCVLITDDNVLALEHGWFRLRSLGLYYCHNITDREMYSPATGRTKDKHGLWLVAFRFSFFIQWMKWRVHYSQKILEWFLQRGIGIGLFNFSAPCGQGASEGGGIDTNSIPTATSEIDLPRDSVITESVVAKLEMAGSVKAGKTVRIGSRLRTAWYSVRI